MNVSRTGEKTRSTLHAKKDLLNPVATTATESALITHSTLSRIARDSDERRTLIEQCAYHHAESRGFSPGHELDDWLAAETEVDARLMGEGHAY